MLDRVVRILRRSEQPPAHAARDRVVTVVEHPERLAGPGTDRGDDFLVGLETARNGRSGFVALGPSCIR